MEESGRRQFKPLRLGKTGPKQVAGGPVADPEVLDELSRRTVANSCTSKACINLGEKRREAHLKGCYIICEILDRSIWTCCAIPRYCTIRTRFDSLQLYDAEHRDFQ
jgi:hypothetical protein